MLEFIFVITMITFSLFISVLTTFVIFCVFNSVLQKVVGIGIADIFDFSISAILNGIRVFLEN